MQWLAAILVLSFAIGLRRRPGLAAHLLLVLSVTVFAAVWYVELARAT